jgi:hypothetical protein
MKENELNRNEITVILKSLLVYEQGGVEIGDSCTTNELITLFRELLRNYPERQIWRLGEENEGV